jgi:hypothetical protein
MSGYRLPRFKAAMAPFAKTLASGTFWRYSNGILPSPLGELLVENPGLLEELLYDVRDLAAQRAERQSIPQQDAA